MNKFGGVGLTNMLVIALFTMLVIVLSKVLLAQYPIDGISTFVQAI